ncbi:hypothetical protein, partial [uncultured Oscillibacter sp.]|uniref:hypothetical protein n=1 Tax=uncultured Oscillibacter sp. TaxID=876091 RepID=UPI002625C395
MVNLRPYILRIILRHFIRQGGDQVLNGADTALISTRTSFTVLRFRLVAAGIVMFLMVLADAGIFRLFRIFFRRFPFAVRQAGILCAADRAVRIDLTLCTEGQTRALLLFDDSCFRFLVGFAAVLRIADFTHIGAWCSRRAFGVAALAVMLMP